MNAKASTTPGMSGVNPGKHGLIVRLQNYIAKLLARRGAARTGLVLSALPLGFGLAALPPWWPPRSSR
jgi:hypothetical protein